MEFSVFRKRLTFALKLKKKVLQLGLKISFMTGFNGIFRRRKNLLVQGLMGFLEEKNYWVYL